MVQPLMSIGSEIFLFAEREQWVGQTFEEPLLMQRFVDTRRIVVDKLRGADPLQSKLIIAQAIGDLVAHQSLNIMNYLENGAGVPAAADDKWKDTQMMKGWRAWAGDDAFDIDRCKIWYIRLLERTALWSLDYDYVDLKVRSYLALRVEPKEGG